MNRLLLIELFYLAKAMVLNLVKFPYHCLHHNRICRKRVKTVLDTILNIDRDCGAVMPSIDLPALQNLFGVRDELSILFGNERCTINLTESVALAYILRTVKPMSLFEIGTFDGFSTYHLAANSPIGAVVYTLNLPVDHDGFEKPAIAHAYGDAEAHNALKTAGVGTIYKNSRYSSKVIQLFGDSRSYDFHRFYGKMDFVFIDGGHSAECIAKDTETAMKLLSPNGMVVWHDFNVQHPYVYRHLAALGHRLHLMHVQNTRLVMMGAVGGNAAMKVATHCLPVRESFTRQVVNGMEEYDERSAACRPLDLEDVG